MTRLPTIRTARMVNKAGELDGTIIIGFAPDGQFSVCSYGRTKKHCSELAGLVDYISAEIELGVVPLPSFGELAEVDA